MSMNILQFVLLLETMRDDLGDGRKVALKRAADLVVKEARGAIGTYKFGWPPLAASTVAQKGKDTPLLRTGALKNSIEGTVISSEEAEAGSNDPKIKWHELGTTKMPPRSVMGEAAKRKEAEVHAILGDHFKMALKLK